MTIIKSLLALLLPVALLADTNTSPDRIGVYDSRVIAYAFFSTDASQRALQDAVQAARAAQTAGDTNRLNQLRAGLAEKQRQLHRQVFGSAPANEALAALKDRLPAIQKEAAVSALISKWDAAALKRRPGAEQIDLTDRLADEFHPGAKELKIIATLKSAILCRQAN